MRKISLALFILLTLTMALNLTFNVIADGDLGGEGCGACCCEPGTVFYIGKDTITKGNWTNAIGSPIGVYGSYAYILPWPPKKGIEVPVGNFSVPVGNFSYTDYGWTPEQIAGLSYSRTDPPYWDEYRSQTPLINYTLTGELHYINKTIGFVQWPVFEWAWESNQTEQGDDLRRVFYPQKSLWRLACWDDGSERDTDGIHSEGYFNVTLEFPEGKFMLSLYAYDYERVQRADQTIIIVGESGDVLATAVMSGTEFDEGIYLQFVVCGPTTITVKVLRGSASINALLSGIFIDKLPCDPWCGRTIGFWKTNIGKQTGKIKGRGYQVPIEKISNALDEIYDTYGWDWIPQGEGKLDEAWLLLNYRDPETEKRMARDPAIKAQAQTLALLLTAEIFGPSGLTTSVTIDGYGTYMVQGWINQIVEEFNSGTPDYAFIYTVADYLNNWCAES